MAQASSFKLKTGRAQIANFVKKGIMEQKSRYIEWLQYIGEQCVNEARLSGSYTDRTGNLRSSIGYAIVEDGRIITVTGFQQVKTGTDGESKGSSYIQELAALNNKGLVLIVVAGMKYAYFVQDKGYNVLDSAESLAEKLINQLMG